MVTLPFLPPTASLVPLVIVVLTGLSGGGAASRGFERLGPASGFVAVSLGLVGCDGLFLSALACLCLYHTNAPAAPAPRRMAIDRAIQRPLPGRYRFMSLIDQSDGC